MADNIDVQPGERPGKVAVATNEVGGTHYPIYNTGFGTKGVVPTYVDPDNPLPVGITGASNPIRSAMEGGGIVSVGTTAVEATFTGTTNKIIIQALGANTGNLYVGASNVTNAGANAIAELEPGDVLTMDYDDVTTAIYVVSDTASQSFIKGALL